MKISLFDKDTHQVTVIGLGSMGMGVAKSLNREDFKVRGFDLNQSAMNEFAEAGGYAAKSAVDAVKDAQVTIFLLVNSDQCDSVLFGKESKAGDDGIKGIIGDLKEGATIMMCTTTAPSYVCALEAKLDAHGVHLIDAPVSGGAAKALQGDMSIMASGKAELFDACDSIFSAIAGKVFRVGDDIGAGQSVKMINQLLAGVHIAASAEAIALGIKAGLDPDLLYEVICSSAGCSWMFENRVPNILSGDYTPKSMVDIFVKDLSIVSDTGKSMKFPLPLTATALQQFLSASAAGHGKEDDSAVIKVFPGIDLPSQDS